MTTLRSRAASGQREAIGDARKTRPRGAARLLGRPGFLSHSSGLGAGHAFPAAFR